MNRGRVALRLASLALLASKDLEQETHQLDETTAKLRPQYTGGSKAQGPALATSLELSSSLRLSQNAAGAQAAVQAAVDEALKIYQATKVGPAASLGTRLVYAQLHGEPVGGEDTAALWKSLAANWRHGQSF